MYRKISEIYKLIDIEGNKKKIKKRKIHIHFDYMAQLDNQYYKKGYAYNGYQLPN